MNRDAARRLLAPVATTASVLALWWGTCYAGIVSEYYLPPPGAVLRTLVVPRFIVEAAQNLALTAARALFGYALAAIIAVPLGLAIGRSPVVSRLSTPLVEFLRPLPSSAVIPVALLFLGLGDIMQIAVVVFGCTWPILVATVDGSRAIDAVLVDVATLLRFNRWRRILAVYLPSTAPFIAAGLRTSLAVSLILAVTAEMIVGRDGIGFFILDMERAFQIREMYAALLLLGLTGYCLNWGFGLIHRRIIYWLP